MTKENSASSKRSRRKRDGMLCLQWVQLEARLLGEFTADLRCRSARRFSQISGHLRTEGSVDQR
jgi:hypothetical protein